MIPATDKVVCRRRKGYNERLNLMKTMLALGAKTSEIKEYLGVSDATICRYKKALLEPKQSWTEGFEDAIKALIEDGTSFFDIAEKFEVSAQTVRNYAYHHGIRQKFHPCIDSLPRLGINALKNGDKPSEASFVKSRDPDNHMVIMPMDEYIKLMENQK